MNELIFNGVNFTAFDAYYATSNFLDGAAKDYTSVSVLGRSGDLQISNNRYKNITVKVRVYVRSNMEQNIRAMRSYLESVNGYARLELSDQPNEYRIGLYKEMFVPSSYDVNVGVVDLTFDCKPQRFLKSGEIPVSASSQSNTYTGNPVSIDNPSGISAVSSLAVALEPIQTGTGEPSPTNIRPITGHTSASVTRTGKNLLQINNNVTNTYTHNGVTYTFARDSQGNLLSITADGTATGGNSYVIISVRPNMQYLVGLGKPIKLSGAPNENGRACLQWWNYNGAGAIAADNGNDSSAFIPTSTAGNIAVQVYNNETVHNAVYKPMILLADETDRTYEPYQSNTYTINLNGTRYGGSVDLTTGVLTVDTKFMTFNGTEAWETINIGFRCALTDRGVTRSAKQKSNWLTGTTDSEPDPATTHNYKFNCVSFIGVGGIASSLAEFKALLASNPLQIVYELATPQTVQLTAQQISLLTGINYISSSDEVTVTVSEPSLLENPTLFESKPLIRVYGHGTLTVNNQYITVATNPFPYIDIDCDIMDAFYGANNANQYVTLPNDYITLKSGNNYIAYDGTVQITPRWYEV